MTSRCPHRHSATLALIAGVTLLIIILRCSDKSTIMVFVSKVPAGRFLDDRFASSTTNDQIPIIPSKITVPFSMMGRIIADISMNLVM